MVLVVEICCKSIAYSVEMVLSSIAILEVQTYSYVSNKRGPVIYSG